MTIGSNISSIYANQDLLNSSAHNIANSTTKGFGRIETNITQNSANAPEAINTKTQNDSEYSNTDLTKEITNQILSYTAISANAVVLRTQNEVNGTLLDIYA
jgi:flagellar hook protein FlgE